MAKEKNKYVSMLVNSYTIILSVFLIWMFFFDENTRLNSEFNKEIKDLQNTIDFYKSEIERDKQTIKQLQDTLQLERFARERYLMKKKNEDVYIIEFDSTKN